MSDLKEALRLQRKELDDMRVHFTEMEKRKKKRKAAKGEFTKLDIANTAEKGAFKKILIVIRYILEIFGSFTKYPLQYFRFPVVIKLGQRVTWPLVKPSQSRKI